MTITTRTTTTAKTKIQRRDSRGKAVENKSN